MDFPWSWMIRWPGYFVSEMMGIHVIKTEFFQISNFSLGVPVPLSLIKGVVTLHSTFFWGVDSHWGFKSHVFLSTYTQILWNRNKKIPPQLHKCWYWGCTLWA
jgi:hypothetical protein